MPTYAMIRSRGEVERWLDSQATGISLDPVVIVQLRCGDCRRRRVDETGQLLGSARRDPNGVWWLFPRHLADASYANHVLVFPLESTGGLFPDLDGDNFEIPVQLRCRHRHPLRPRLRAWLRSRAARTWDEGLGVMHV